MFHYTARNDDVEVFRRKWQPAHVAANTEVVARASNISDYVAIPGIVNLRLS
jgi:hypothetical protein